MEASKLINQARYVCAYTATGLWLAIAIGATAILTVMTFTKTDVFTLHEYPHYYGAGAAMAALLAFDLADEASRNRRRYQDVREPRNSKIYRQILYANAALFILYAAAAALFALVTLVRMDGNPDHLVVGIAIIDRLEVLAVTMCAIALALFRVRYLSELKKKIDKATTAGDPEGGSPSGA